MRVAASAALLVSLALGGGLHVRAQQDQARDEAVETSRPYVPPSAANSVEVGNYYLRRKKLRAALSRFQEAVKTDPYYAPAYLGLGQVYEKIGLKQKALNAYRKYLDLLPSQKEAEEAKQVHRAIARLEHQINKPKRRSRDASPGAGVTLSPR